MDFFTRTGLGRERSQLGVSELFSKRTTGGDAFRLVHFQGEDYLQKWKSGGGGGFPEIGFYLIFHRFVFILFFIDSFFLYFL